MPPFESLVCSSVVPWKSDHKARNMFSYVCVLHVARHLGSPSRAVMMSRTLSVHPICRPSRRYGYASNIKILEGLHVKMSNMYPPTRHPPWCGVAMENAARSKAETKQWGEVRARRWGRVRPGSCCRTIPTDNRSLSNILIRGITSPYGTDCRLVDSWGEVRAR